MKKIIFLLFLLAGLKTSAQDSVSLKTLINHVVGGTWISTNANNEGKPEDYKTFYMYFENWSDNSSVTGSIFGIRNNGDTTQLIEIWNFIDEANDNIFFVQRTTWGWHGTGTITPHKGKNLDIQFKMNTPEGQQFYTRDIHMLDGKNQIQAITYHKAREDDEWKEASRSSWTRTY